jgi:pimeloyl-CoA synthetase
MMLNVHELNVELAKIKGDIKMINSHIEIIKTNHLKHIEEDLKNVRRIMWGVGFMMMTQMIVVIREYIIK